ncbi:MAG: hypothetical protein IJX98_03275 [Clostridia bacterium]|nr:hypothetical protein [Clostridia bacterium]
MDEFGMKHSFLDACKEMGIDVAKYKSGRSSFGDGCSSTDRLGEAACAVAQDCMYILANTPQRSETYKQMKTICADLLQVWDECGHDESSRKEDALLERYKSLANRVKPMRAKMMDTKANPHAVCSKELEEMIQGMEYLYSQYQSDELVYMSYAPLKDLIPIAKAALEKLSGVAVFNTAEANTIAKEMQAQVTTIRNYLVKNVHRLDKSMMEKLVKQADEWAQIAVRGRQKPIADKLMVKEAENDEVDYLLGFIEQEKDIVAFIAQAEQEYDVYNRYMERSRGEINAIDAKKMEIKSAYKNGRMTKEQALREIETLDMQKATLMNNLADYELSSGMVVAQHDFALKIKNLYFVTMKGFSYQDKQECFQSESGVGIDLQKCMEDFRVGFAVTDGSAIETANDALDLIITRVAQNAANMREMIEKRNAQRAEQLNTLRAKQEEQRKKALERAGITQQQTQQRSAAESFLDDEEEEEELDSIEVDPLGERTQNEPQRQQQQASEDDLDAIIFGEQTRTRN